MNAIQRNNSINSINHEHVCGRVGERADAGQQVHPRGPREITVKIFDNKSVGKQSAQRGTSRTDADVPGSPSPPVECGTLLVFTYKASRPVELGMAGWRLLTVAFSLG